MGPGIRIQYARRVLCAIVALLALAAAAGLYLRFRSPVGGMSPHETVNTLYEWEYMTFAAGRESYPGDVEEVCLYFKNDAPNGGVWLSSQSFFAYELEILENGVWHSMRPGTERPKWSDNAAGGAPGTDIVDWNGGELTLYCRIARDYPVPLQPGRYRIVLPDCQHLESTADLAAEFEVE